ncbi:MAG: hypothetical protein P8141_07120, partial [Gammaproteobacteria bacterium]
RVRIVTPDTRLPEGFDFASNAGLGIGLKLVKSLLPSKGCQLQIRNDATNVIADLLISSPVLAPVSAP